MTALYTVCGILLFLLWLISRYLHMYIEFIDGRIRLRIRYLFIKKDIAVDTGKKHAVPQQKEIMPQSEQTDGRESKSQLPIKELLCDIFDLIKKIFKNLGKSLTVQKCDVRALIAFDDPAKTALIYGASSGAAAQLTELILKMRHGKSAYMHTLIEPDFLAEKPIFFCDIHLKIRICNLLPTAKDAIAFILKINQKKIKQKKEQNDAKRNATQTDN